MHTDASGSAISGILYTRDKTNALHPVAFHSYRLKPAEERYSATDRELLAIVDLLRVFRHYVSGLKFLVKMDHKPLQYFFTQSNLNSRQVRWLERLSEF